jgi:hypothetical protein
MLLVSALYSWYDSETARRVVGGLCQRIDEQRTFVYLDGTPAAPLLILAPAELYAVQHGEIHVSIEEVKADWLGITTAASMYGTQFRIRGRRVIRAVLTRHPTNRHPAAR